LAGCFLFLPFSCSFFLLVAQVSFFSSPVPCLTSFATFLIDALILFGWKKPFYNFFASHFIFFPICTSFLPDVSSGSTAPSTCRRCIANDRSFFAAVFIGRTRIHSLSFFLGPGSNSLSEPRVLPPSSCNFFETLQFIAFGADCSAVVFCDKSLPFSPHASSISPFLVSPSLAPHS